MPTELLSGMAYGLIVYAVGFWRGHRWASRHGTTNGTTPGGDARG